MEPDRAEPVLGIIIPCYNEEKVFPLLRRELEALIQSLTHEVRVLFVDDGSTDRTLSLIREACESNGEFGCLSLSRNFGHQMAVTAGLDHIEGEIVVVMDADLQDPPDLIPKMIDKWREGYQVVYGIRKKRKESVMLRFAYALFYRILRRISNVDIPLDAGDFALMDRRIVDKMKSMPERNRFIRGLRGWVGFKQTGIEYDRNSRQAGDSKYYFRDLLKLALDGLISFSALPLRIASWIGAGAAVFGFASLVYTVILALLFEQTPSGWASLAVIIMFFGGVQLLVMGIIGEYLGRIFEEVKSRPKYILSEQIGWIRPLHERTEKSGN